MILQYFAADTPTVPLSGGDILGKGGYGCVFYPRLKCRGAAANAVTATQKNEISKLMKTRYANDEYREYKNYEKDIFSIKNHKDYFLFDNITKCIPENIPIDELEKSFKCDSILEIHRDGDSDTGTTTSTTTSTAYSETDKDVLQKRLVRDIKHGKYSIINMPFGGISLYNWIQSHKSRKDFIWMNSKLRELITHAIQPLNERGIYHNDIKSDNILVEGDHFRLVDWGLSYRYNGKTAPKRLRRSAIQFNLPFSNILYSLSQSRPTTKEQLREFIVKNRVEGHAKYIESNILPFMYPHGVNDFYAVLEQYLRPIFELSPAKFGEFLKHDYFTFCDVYGICTVYFDFIDDAATPQSVKKIIRELFVDYLWKEPLNVTTDKLFKYMDRMNRAAAGAAAGGGGRNTHRRPRPPHPHRRSRRWGR
jgi:serine/threonine protein kinase